MFGKIRDRLKNVFEKSEELIEENADEEVEVSIDELPQKEKKSFLSKVFGKKEEAEDEPETQEIIEKSIIEEPKKEKPKKKETKSKVEKKVQKPKDQSPEIKKELIEPEIEEIIESKLEEPETQEIIEEPIVEEKKGFFSKVFGKKEETPIIEEVVEGPRIEEKEESLLSKTFTKLKSKSITEEDFDKIWIELEIFLLEINIAFEIVETIQEKLKEELVGNAFNRFKLTEKIKEVLASEVEKVLITREANFMDKLNEIKAQGTPVKIIILGVNGTGKTTSIAKIVHYLQKNSLSVVVAAADTFRAAAIEQLEEHSKKLNFRLIHHKGGSDPAAVAFDAIEHAKAKNIDIVLIDTAGRMPNNSNLMMELQKIKRVSEAQLAIFIGDSISGNDLIDQIELFNKGVEIDGAILTKVDTDEKPGSIVTTAYAIEKPIYFLGIGQTYDDLIPFDAKEIAQKLFNADEE